MILLAFACSGTDTTDATDTDTPTHETGTPDTTAGTGLDWEVVDPTWDGMERFFELYCDSCHPSQQGLDLHVDLAADVSTGYGRWVVPGDPDASKLWQVLIGAGYSAAMPYQADLLPLDVVDPVRVWIEDGAVIP